MINAYIGITVILGLFGIKIPMLDFFFGANLWTCLIFLIISYSLGLCAWHRCLIYNIGLCLIISMLGTYIFPETPSLLYVAILSLVWVSLTITSTILYYRGKIKVTPHSAVRDCR